MTEDNGKHVHKYELMIGADEDIIHEPDALSSGTLHVYAECKCGDELDKEEIEFRINNSARNHSWKD